MSGKKDTGDSSSALRTTMRQLEQMDRRLDLVIDNCMSEAEKKIREQQKFELTKEQLLNNLSAIRKDIFRRDDLKRNQRDIKEALMINSKCRLALKDNKEKLDYLIQDYESSKATFGDSPTPEQSKLLNRKENHVEHARDMYNIVLDLYEHDATTEGGNAQLNELMSGVSVPTRSVRPSDENIELSADNFTAIDFNAPRSEMEEQWQELLQRSQQIEDQYLDVIEANVQQLREMAIGASAELDRQSALIDQVGGQISDNQEKLTTLNKKVDQANKLPHAL
ncbi:hypothetical protein BLNAU_2627 [Blattamonas nauphoetae]|uniref:t-SNARE coiled-coil homology domain-containing protein n=1 Tax=Blattamonas nauphoetae TaxID=2049346 RepID=A0ABQ9YF42_9EUKA|nr:hypothetical protein BLNAU_2627 [Blattamonas nauphoetae]